MVYKITTPLAGMQKLTVSSPTKQHDLGTIVTGSDPVLGAGEFIYTQMPATAVAVGDVLTYPNSLAVAGAASNNGPCGVAMAAHAVAPPTNYGWLQIGGRAVTKFTGANFAVGAPAYLGAASAAIAAVTATDQIFNAFAATVGAGGFVNLDLNRPWAA
jgi:hypothetical protein